MEFLNYQALFSDIKLKIQRSQIKSALAVNSELILLYWEIGKSIAEKQNQEGWSAGIIPRLSKDLQLEIPGTKGFSERNLGRMLAFYREYPEASILPQLVAKLPWGHNIILIEKIKDKDLRFWYAEQCISNSWSRDILDTQIKTNLIGRLGKSVNNFENALPIPLSDLANQTLKDPYIFDFLTLDAQHRERDIEKQLIQHITQFLLELGKGFAFIGNQFHLKVGENDYYLDLLFYHTRLKCYVVIELKNTQFIPEYAGKLNFYLSAVDSLIKDTMDNPTIGILLCKDKSNIEVEFALRDINKPMGISELKFSENIPENLKSSLPTIEEIEEEFDKIKK
jgi:predicted nuclease of restriction endonuclease-like (RecB) superfamily